MLKNKYFVAITLFLLVLLTVSIPASAHSVQNIPYEGYEYNDYDETVAAPPGYSESNIFSAKSMGLDVEFNSPSDMCYDSNAGLYILDSGNSRIILLNENGKLIKEFSNFTFNDGTSVDFSGARGFSVTKDGVFYIADTDRNRVLCISNGKVDFIIERPDEVLLNTDAAFRATKVLTNVDGNIFVIVEGIDQGAFVFEKDGTFSNFLGSNNVEVTADVIFNNMLKRFLTREQIAGLTQATPISIDNFDIDSEGLIYVVTQGEGSVAEPGTVRCLNFKGSDILNAKTAFGDLEWDRLVWKESKVTKFIDVDIDDGGFLNLLDVDRGKIMQYTKDAKLVAVFGGYGNEHGMFSSPIAVESMGDRVAVLDAINNTVTVFSPTTYGKKLRNAFALIENNEISSSIEVLQELLISNTNTQNVYYGLGVCYDAMGDYTKAMENFKLSGDYESYSKAFRQYRKEFIADNYYGIILAFALIIVVIFVVSKVSKKVFVKADGEVYSPIESRYGLPFYVLLHPSDGFDQLKERKIYSYKMISAIFTVWFILNSLEFFNKGFIFNRYRSIDYNLATMLVKTVIIFLMFIISNWSVCTIFDGKGSLPEISSVTVYAITPMIITKAITLILSNVLTLEEGTIMTMISAVGIIWFVFILIIGLSSVHQYSISKTLVTILISILGIAIIALLVVLFYTLLKQAWNFAMSIISELQLR